MTRPIEVEHGRWYPDVPPSLEGEGDDAYTNRLTGADHAGRRPYDHPRNRQCSIGYHNECSDPNGEQCKCPHHTDVAPLEDHVTIAVTNAATTLARLYYLPLKTTALRVMAEAYWKIVYNEITTKDALRDRINAMYDTKVSDGFVIDVISILGFRDRFAQET